MRALIVAAAAALLLGLPSALAAGGPVTGVEGLDPLTGKHVSLEQWNGRAVAINVWASWCEGCNKEASALKRFETAHRGAVLGIDFNDSKAGARRFYKTYDFEHPSIFDPKGVVVSRLKAIGLPTTVFLNRKHVVVYAIAGAATLAQLNEGWRRATGGRAPSAVPRRVPAPIVVTGFVTPSGNIICNAGPEGTLKGKPLLACTVLSAESPTQGQKLWAMRQDGRVQVGYLIGNAASDLPGLAYGKTWRWKGFTCVSKQSGLTCTNSAGHGFFLSRASQRVF